MQKTVYLIIMVLLIGACDTDRKRQKREEDNTIRAAVFLSAGDNYPPFNSLGIPTFFNIGRIIKPGDGSLLTLILCERKSKGTRLSVTPLALLSFEKDTTTFKFIISTDASESNSYLGTEKNDFLIQNYQTQMNIENWFASQCSDGRCSNFRWDNRYKALLEINQHSSE